MKALGEAAIDLPWLSPSVASLTALTRARLSLAWTQLRSDPGMALLLARAAGHVPDPRRNLLDHDVPLLEAAQRHLQGPGSSFVDWNQPGPARIYRVAILQARLAAALATKTGADPDKAWIGGLAAPLGWLAACAVNPAQAVYALDELERGPGFASWQQEAWGLDHTAIARRLARLWRLPPWLTTIIGHLALHVSITERLGADPLLFQVVQLAVLLCQQRETGLGLGVGSEVDELLTALDLHAAAVDEVTRAAFDIEMPVLSWDPPGRHALLPDLISLSLENRRQADIGWVEGLQRDLDRLQEALEEQCVEEKSRLQSLKLAALAEMAAGAGHEINNPLAVISGQAQYILKQFNELDGPASEIENIGEYLDNLKNKVFPSVSKIVGQTQRIHHILTDLMQFARPASPRRQVVVVDTLVREVAETLQSLATERQIRLVVGDVPAELVVHADPAQLRLIVARLLRNAVEAAPTDGWAGVRCEMKEALQIIVEDSGDGPTPAAREHLFDPFYSGRSAGRGRGLGLPTAWRLARQHGGDVRFDGHTQGVTRFVVTLPLPLPGEHPPHTNGQANGKGHHLHQNGRQATSADVS